MNLWKTITRVYRRSKFLKLANSKLRIRPPIIPSKIVWGEGEYQAVFYFYAPVPIAIKAKERGIENTLLRISWKLLSNIAQEAELNIVDVGANYGFLSLVYASWLKEGRGQVFSFEPHPQIARILRKSIRKNRFNNIQLFNVAVGREEKEIEIGLMENTANVLLSSGKKAKVPQLTLDRVFEKTKIHLIKIDVDGYEMEVLEGATKVIRQFAPIIIAELNGDTKIVDFLLQFGYDTFDMNLERIDVSQLPPNVIAVPK